MNKLLGSIFLILLMLSQYLAAGMVVYDCQVTGMKSFSICCGDSSSGDSSQSYDSQPIPCCPDADSGKKKKSQRPNDCCDIEPVVLNNFILLPIESKREDQINKSSPDVPLHNHIDKNQCLNPHLQTRFTPHLPLSAKSNPLYIHHCSFLL